MVYFEDLLRCATWALIRAVLAGLKSSLCHGSTRFWGTDCNVVVTLLRENSWPFQYRLTCCLLRDLLTWPAHLSPEVLSTYDFH